MMNLLVRLSNNPVIYPLFESNQSGKKPKLLMIPDSFYHTMEHHAKNIFDYEFWYYYDKYWKTNPFKLGTLEELVAYYQTFDLVVLMCTEVSLDVFPWEFLMV